MRLSDLKQTFEKQGLYRPTPGNRDPKSIQHPSLVPRLSPVSAGL